MGLSWKGEQMLPFLICIKYKKNKKMRGKEKLVFQNSPEATPPKRPAEGTRRAATVRTVRPRVALGVGGCRPVPGPA